MTRRRKLVLLLLSAAFLVWGLHALLAYLPSDQTPHGGPIHADMTAYWTAGRLFLERGNPYDAATVGRMEGLPPNHDAEALVMRNAPWALPIAVPLGALSYRNAFFAWDVSSLAAVLFALALLTGVYGLAPPSLRGFVPLLFVPTYLLVLDGQTTWLVLLGFALFLACAERRPAAAGAALFLASVKFNICFLFWPAFLLWAIDRRRWRCLGALAGSLGAAMAIVLVWDPKVVGQYLQSLVATQVATQRFPNLVGTLRFEVGGAWPAFVIPATGVVWAIAHYLRHRAGWSWKEQTPLLLLVSLALAPYSFLFDELIANVAIVAAAANLRGRQRSWQWEVFGLFLAAQALLLLLLARNVNNRTTGFIWTPLTWLALYLIAMRGPAGAPKVASAGAA